MCCVWRVVFSVLCVVCMLRVLCVVCCVLCCALCVVQKTSQPTDEPTNPTKKSAINTHIKIAPRTLASYSNDTIPIKNTYKKRNDPGGTYPPLVLKKNGDTKKISPGVEGKCSKKKSKKKKEAGRSMYVAEKKGEIKSHPKTHAK